MLQRSPSYYMPLPERDPIADLLRRLLPAERAYRAVRWKNIRTSSAFYAACQRWPARMRALLRRIAVKSLPAGGDIFAAIRDGSVEVVTDHIDTFTATGLRLRSGRELDADVVVAATGLNLLPLGGIGLSLDGAPVVVSQHVAYKGMMLDGVPNMAFALGYTNASWTLKVDLVSSYVARLLSFMRRGGYDRVTPRLPTGPLKTTPFIEMTSGYFERSRDLLPLQGPDAPWRLRQVHRKDATLFSGPVNAPELEFSVTKGTSAAAGGPAGAATDPAVSVPMSA
jgi:cation diffusion facilitator CzcD-associated flavoprotein CzcO